MRKCPKGTVRLKLSKKNQTKTRKTHCTKGIGPLRKGDLSQFGYTDVDSLSETERHAALEQAIQAYGALSVFRKLNAIYVYTRKSSPTSSRIFKADRDWIRATHM